MPSACFINKFLPSVLPITQVQNLMMASLTALFYFYTLCSIYGKIPLVFLQDLCGVWLLSPLFYPYACYQQIILLYHCRSLVGVSALPLALQGSVRLILLFFIFFWPYQTVFRMTPGFMLRDHSWQYSEDHIWCLGLDLRLLCARPMASLLCYLSGKRFVPKLQSVTCLKHKPDNVLADVLKWSWALTTPFTYYHSVPHSFCVHQDYFVFWPLFPDVSSWFLALLAWLPFRSAQMKSWEDQCTDYLKPKSIPLSINYCFFFAL